MPFCNSMLPEELSSETTLFSYPFFWVSNLGLFLEFSSSEGARKEEIMQLLRVLMKKEKILTMTHSATPEGSDEKREGCAHILAHFSRQERCEMLVQRSARKKAIR